MMRAPLHDTVPSPGVDPWRARPQAWAALAAAAAAVLVFAPSLGHGFVNWDDAEYVYANPYLDYRGLRLLGWAFGHFHSALWIPATWLSLALDRAVFGPEPFGHHLVNVLLHAVNVALVAVVAARLARAGRPDLGDRGAAAAGLVAALAFGLHPLRVESVAWVTERKDVLSGLFTLAALVAWTRHAAPGAPSEPPRPPGRAYAAALVLFCAALLAKAMPVALPVVLLVLDVYPYRRLRRGNVGRVLLEKLPFIAASAAISAIALLAMSAAGALPDSREVAVATRLLVFARAVGFYVTKTVWPVGLLPLYPYADAVSFGGAVDVSEVVLAVALTAACAVAAWRGVVAPLAAWISFLVLILPVSGLFQNGGQPWADRFTYLPALAPAVLVGAAGVLGLRRLGTRALRGAALAGAALAMAALAARSISQVAIWRDGETLWTHMVRHRPDFGPGWTYRAEWRSDTGRQEEALADLRIAMTLPPPSPEPFYYVGLVQLRLGDAATALAAFDTAIASSSYGDWRFFEGRADALARLGRDAEAARDYGAAIELGLDRPSVFARRAAVEERSGRVPAAVADWSRALDLSPTPIAQWEASRRAAASAGRQVAPR
jgi:protein O-mannosyl-transferase